MVRDVKVVWQYGNICNTTCPYCLNAAAAKANYRNATLDETNRVVEVLNSIPVQRVNFIGGEPTCFAHLLHALRQLDCPEIELSTNGLRDDIVAEAAQTMVDTGRVLHLCFSVHPHLVEVDPVAYRARVERYMAMAANGLLDMDIMLVVDGHHPPSRTLVDFATWLTGHDWRGSTRLTTTFVRVGADPQQHVVDFVKAYQAAAVLPDVFRQLLRLSERADVLRPNPWQGKPCQMFRYQFTLQLDGYLRSSDCVQGKLSRRSVYDPAFDWNDEIITCTCTQPHMVSNGNCMAAHDVHNYKDTLFTVNLAKTTT